MDLINECIAYKLTGDRKILTKISDGIINKYSEGYFLTKTSRYKKLGKEGIEPKIVESSNSDEKSIVMFLSKSESKSYMNEIKDWLDEETTQKEIKREDFDSYFSIFISKNFRFDSIKVYVKTPVYVKIPVEMFSDRLKNYYEDIKDKTQKNLSDKPSEKKPCEVQKTDTKGEYKSECSLELDAENKSEKKPKKTDTENFNGEQADEKRDKKRDKRQWKTGNNGKFLYEKGKFRDYAEDIISTFDKDMREKKFENTYRIFNIHELLDDLLKDNDISYETFDEENGFEKGFTKDFTNEKNLYDSSISKDRLYKILKYFGLEKYLCVYGEYSEELSEYIEKLKKALKADYYTLYPVKHDPLVVSDKKTYTLEKITSSQINDKNLGDSIKIYKLYLKPLFETEQAEKTILSIYPENLKVKCEYEVVPDD